jgi:molecular chaperone GrpE (heat shock protein)
MLKFLGLLLLVIGAFGIGYYFGQRPVGTLQQTVSDLQQSLKDLSRNVLDTTLGIERDLRRRQGLVDAKSRLVQAKADIFDRNFGDAAKELAEAVDALEAATQGAKSDDATNAVKDLASSLREVRLEIAMGKSVPLKKLDEIQHRMDQLLNK